MPPYTVKLYLPEKKSVWGSRYASKLSVVGVEDFCKVFFCATLLLKANQGSGNASNHFPQKGICFYFKNEEVPLLKKAGTLYVAESGKALVAGRGKGCAVKLSVQERAHLVQRVKVWMVWYCSHVTAVAGKGNFLRQNKIPVDPACCVKA